MGICPYIRKISKRNNILQCGKNVDNKGFFGKAGFYKKNFIV